jgi:DNA-binding MarR family transcriptional regulator
MTDRDGPQVSDASAAVLHHLAVKTLAKDGGIGRATGRPVPAVAHELASLEQDGLVESTKLGWRLTEEGRALVEALRRAELADGVSAELDRLYEAFEDPNDRMLELSTGWQLVTVAGQQIPNDHSDPDHDARVLTGFSELHEDFAPTMEGFVAALPRLGTYRQRLEHAIQRIEAGDVDYVTRTDRDSYHTVWFELHEELLQLLGRQRRHG